MRRHRFTKKDREKAKRARKKSPQHRGKWTARDSKAYQKGFEAGWFHGAREGHEYGNPKKKIRRRFSFRRR